MTLRNIKRRHVAAMLNMTTLDLRAPVELARRLNGMSEARRVWLVRCALRNYLRTR